jgi:glycosyltransferase involved in cell wall biosynthesis
VVLPYIDASQSGIIPLAYSFKKPVVVTDVGSIPESVDDGVTGFIVPPKDPAALAEAILKLLEDEKLRRTMGENGYRKLKSELSIDIAAKEILKVYIKALEITKGSSQKRIL